MFLVSVGILRVSMWARSIHDDLHIHSVAAVKHGAGGGRLSTAEREFLRTWHAVLAIEPAYGPFPRGLETTLAMCLHLLTIREGLNFSH